MVDSMVTAPLGPGGPAISRLGLGTMTFGVESDAAAATAQLDRFIERGGTFVDTADVYGGGEFERIVGRWLAARRPETVVIANRRPVSSAAGLARRVAAVAGAVDRRQP